MSSFVILSIVLFAGAAAFVVVPLWRAAPSNIKDSAEPPRRWMAVWLGTALAFATVLLYLVVGEPAALSFKSESDVSASTATQTGAANVPPEQIEAMVARLAQRLQKQPQDPDGWRMLAKSYETLGRFQMAVSAYRHLFALEPPNADLLSEYAVTLGMSLDHSLVGDPEEAINQALKLEPHHVQALALSGSAAFEREDYARAMAQWRKLLAVIPQDADMRVTIESNLAKAESLAQRRVQPAPKR